MATLLSVTNSASGGNSIGNNGGYARQGQSFTPDNLWTVSAVIMPLLRGGGTDNVPVILRIETDSAGLPSGTLADANATVTISSFTDAGHVNKTFTFPGTFELSNGVKYWLVLKTAESEGSGQYYRDKYDGVANNYAGGGHASYSGSWTDDGAADNQFSIEGFIGSPSPSLSVSLSPSRSVSLSPSASVSPSSSVSLSPSRSVSLSPSASQSPSSSISASISPSPSVSVSASPSRSISASPSVSISPSQPPGDGYFSKESAASLPTTKTNLDILYGEEDETDVSTDNGVRVAIDGMTGEYLLHQYRFVNTSNKDSLHVRVNLQTSLAPTSSTVYLQIWNTVTLAWVTLTSNTTAAANTDFDLEVSIDSDFAKYYDSDYEVAIRVYQLLA